MAGGMELALWADLRVACEQAQFGILCRLRGVPLIDGECEAARADRWE